MTTFKKPAALRWSLLLLAAGATGTLATQSLDDARAAIRKGTAPGITIIPARSKAASAPQAATPATLPASAAAPAATNGAGGGATGATVRPAVPAAPEGKGLGGFLSTLPPPSGQPMSASKRLNAPDLGIAVPASAPGGR